MKSIKVSVSFKDTEEEKELYDYLMNKAKIIGTSAAIKLILKRSMEREK